MKEIGRYGIEAYLKKQVAAAGGETRKFASTYRPNNPDQIVIWPRKIVNFISAILKPTRIVAEIHFVETKAAGKKPRASQEREHKRLRALGCTVLVLDTKAKIDEYVRLHR